MPYEARRSGGSIVVPVMLIVFGAMIVLAFARIQIGVARLDRTDRIACQFLTADAKTRAEQAKNATKTADAQRTFVKRTDALTNVFRTAAAKSGNPAQSRPLIDYLDAQKRVVATSRTQSLKNIALTRELAAKGARFATQLHC